MDKELDTFVTSDGGKHLLGWGVCSCYVWLVSWQYAKSAGRCGRCRTSVRYCTLGTTKEEAIEVFKNVNDGKEPEDF